MNFYNAIDNPNLIDFSTKHFISNNLKMCHHNRVSYYTYAFNSGILFLFVLVVFVVLYSLSNYKQSTAEFQEKMMNDQDYILSKIKHYKDTNKNNQSMITELPTIPNNMPIHNLPYL